MGDSFRRIAGMLCYAFAGFMIFVFVMSAINRIFWHLGYSVVEDAITFSVMGVIVLAAASAGYLLKPGPFSLRTLLAGITILAFIMGAAGVLLRSS